MTTRKIAVYAGDNKYGHHTCPTCRKEPEATYEGRPVFVFDDILSAKEYTISGMCQDCQDSVFGKTKAMELTQ